MYPDNNVIDIYIIYSIDIYILAEEYKESITKAIQIEGIITAIKGDVLGTKVLNSKLIAGAEMYYLGSYIQKLSFLIKTAA